MTQRVRITVEGEAAPGVVYPRRGAEAMVTGSFAPYHWSIKGTVTAIETIAPPLTAEEALREIEQAATKEAPDSLGVDPVWLRDIIARTKQTKQPEPTEQEGLREEWHCTALHAPKP